MFSKNCIMIHGCPSIIGNTMDKKMNSYDKHWIPWLKIQLELANISTEVPLMPKPWHPVYEDYKKIFEKLRVDENTILVGHSCGCAFLVRWLGETKKNIDSLILVAPWKISKVGDKSKCSFYTYDIDKSIKNRVKNIIMFTSNDEKEDGKISLKLFNDSIGGKIINLPNHGHYTLNTMGTVEFPELLSLLVN